MRGAKSDDRSRNASLGSYQISLDLEPKSQVHSFNSSCNNASDRSTCLRCDTRDFDPSAVLFRFRQASARRR